MISGRENPMDNDTDGIPEVTLGEILTEEFLQPMGISVYRPVKDTAVPVTLISEILRGRGRITAEMALRLSAYFGNSAEFQLDIQDEYKYLQVKSIYYKISLHPKEKY